MVLRALKAGAKGYLLKDSLRGEVVQAIRAASQGRSFLTRKVARILQEDYIGRLQQRVVVGYSDLFPVDLELCHQLLPAVFAVSYA